MGAQLGVRGGRGGGVRTTARRVFGGGWGGGVHAFWAAETPSKAGPLKLVLQVAPYLRLRLLRIAGHSGDR